LPSDIGAETSAGLKGFQHEMGIVIEAIALDV
jgi:hypothetical protein